MLNELNVLFCSYIIVSMKNKWGFLRETSEIAKRAGYDRDTGLKRTGLDEYLAVIFPNTHDWIHDSTIEGVKSRKRPDYRSESLKLIVEFDGIPHYTMPSNIIRDIENTKFYEELGYKVVRIPYFIQLSNKAVKTLFGVDVKEQLFDETIPSLGPKGRDAPAYLCGVGIERMAKEFRRFPEQYEVNIKALKDADDEYNTGVSLLEECYKRYCSDKPDVIHNFNLDGMLKNWILRDNKSDLIGDVLQKINFSISDLNQEIKNYHPSPRSIIYQIVLSSWILEGSELLSSLFKPEVIEGFKYTETDFEKSKKYIKALRSFIVAHPLTTNRHKDFSLDGDFVCTDIYANFEHALLFVSEDRAFALDLEGMKKCNPANCNFDYCLKVYSKKKDNYNFYEIIGCSFKDLYFSINKIVSYIEAIDRYLKNVKKKDYN